MHFLGGTFGQNLVEGAQKHFIRPGTMQKPIHFMTISSGAGLGNMFVHPGQVPGGQLPPGHVPGRTCSWEDKFLGGQVPGGTSSVPKSPG